MSGFLVFVILAGWVFSLALDTSVILYIAVAFSIISAFVSYWWSDKIVLKMSGAKRIEFEDNKELYRIVENLCITAGLPLPKIYIIDDTAPNAFATGRDPEHAVVAVTKGLLQKLERNEVEGVISHELSHVGNRDILIATITTVLVGFTVLLADWFRYWAFLGGLGDRGNGRGGQLQIIIIVVAILLSILAPIFAYMMKFAISRKAEFRADADGALLTRYPEGLASALEKISADTEPLESANRATAHMYISSPFEGKRDKRAKKKFFAKAFKTHPPVKERISALREMSK